MDKFLDTYDHPQLKQESINNINRSVTHNETEAAIKSLQKKKNQGPDRISAEFNQTVKEEPILFKIFHEIERAGILPNSFYDQVLHSSQNRKKTHPKQENYRPIYLKNIDAKMLNILIAN
jgi:hypothetical protein